MSAIQSFGALALSVLCLIDPFAALDTEPEPAGRLVMIYFEEAPLVGYVGGLEGLEATAPIARGEDRLNARSPASHAYLELLDRRHVSYLDALSRVLGRTVRPVFRYCAVRNGVAVTPKSAQAPARSGSGSELD